MHIRTIADIGLLAQTGVFPAEEIHHRRDDAGDRVGFVGRAVDWDSGENLARAVFEIRQQILQPMVFPRPRLRDSLAQKMLGKQPPAMKSFRHRSKGGQPGLPRGKISKP